MADQPQGHDVTQQAAQQTGQNVQVRIDERDMDTNYANAFRVNGTAEEVMLDFGINLQTPAAGEAPEIVFRVSDRLVMNYHSVKRLAITLGQVVRRHEEQFGELELDVNKRRQSQAGE
jgi:hypothetical protein